MRGEGITGSKKGFTKGLHNSGNTRSASKVRPLTGRDGGGPGPSHLIADQVGVSVPRAHRVDGDALGGHLYECRTWVWAL